MRSSIIPIYKHEKNNDEKPIQYAGILIEGNDKPSGKPSLEAHLEKEVSWEDIPSNPMHAFTYSGNKDELLTKLCRMQARLNKTNAEIHLFALYDKRLEVLYNLDSTHRYPSPPEIKIFIKGICNNKDYSVQSKEEHAEQASSEQVIEMSEEALIGLLLFSLMRDFGHSHGHSHSHGHGHSHSHSHGHGHSHIPFVMGGTASMIQRLGLTHEPVSPTQDQEIAPVTPVAAPNSPTFDLSMTSLSISEQTKDDSDKEEEQSRRRSPR